MAVYEIPEQLLHSKPEIRIGDKIYKVDDRQKTVKKFSKLGQNDSDDGDNEMIKLALGEKAAKEIDEMNLPFPAQTELIILIGAAMTGEEPDAVRSRFQESTKKQA